MPLRRITDRFKLCSTIGLRFAECLQLRRREANYRNNGGQKSHLGIISLSGPANQPKLRTGHKLRHEAAKNRPPARLSELRALRIIR